MTDVLTVRTRHAELVELARAFAPRVDEQRIMLYGPSPMPDGAWVRFVIMLRDGSTAFEGVGRCVASLDNGPGEDPAERWDIVLEALQLEGRDEVMFERILVAREGAERGDPPTGEMSIPAVDKLESATLASAGNWSDEGDETEVAPGTDDLVDVSEVERLPSEMPPPHDRPRPPISVPGTRAAPPMPMRAPAVPTPVSAPRAPTPGTPPRAPVAPAHAAPVAPARPAPAPAPPAVRPAPAPAPAAPAPAARPAPAAARPSPGLPPRPAAPPRPDGAARKVAPAPRPVTPMAKASRPDLASPSKPPAAAHAAAPAKAPAAAPAIAPDAAALAALTREAPGGPTDAFDQDIRTLEERIAEDLHTIEIRDEDKTQQVDLSEMARRSMQEEAAALPDFTSETTLPEAKMPPPPDDES